MSVSVVAVLTARPGMGPRVIDSFREVTPLVHEEPGCVLYAAHLERDGDTIVMVERWATQRDLDAHATGAALARLNELNAELLTSPYNVWLLDEVPMGTRTKGRIPRGVA